MVTETIIYKSHIRKQLIENLILNEELSKKDLRIAILLMTKLGGYGVNEDIRLSDKRLIDPSNYVSIDILSISETLNIPKKEVKKSIKKLIKWGVLEDGSSSTTKHGYRFTF